MRVLLVEDEVISRMILERAIQRLGHESLVVSDGMEAWEAYQRNAGDIDVIISDWMMPGMDGLALCEKVREHAETRAANGGDISYPFFVFLSALGDRDHLLEGLRAGADDLLKKPLDREELEARLLTAERLTSLQRRLAGQKRDLNALNTSLFAQTRRDSATGLGNRLRLEEDLEFLRARVERYRHAYCVILCGVDPADTPGVENDGATREASDGEALRKLAGAIKETFRAGDVVYRYDLQEFLIIVPEQTLRTAAIAAERLRRNIEALAIPRGAGVLTVSCGLAGFTPEGTKSADELLGEAEAALIDARKHGRNLVAFFGGAGVEPNGDPGEAGVSGASAE